MELSEILTIVGYIATFIIALAAGALLDKNRVQVRSLVFGVLTKFKILPNVKRSIHIL